MAHKGLVVFERMVFARFSKVKDFVNEALFVTTDRDGHHVWVYIKPNEGNDGSVDLLFVFKQQTKLVPKFK